MHLYCMWMGTCVLELLWLIYWIINCHANARTYRISRSGKQEHRHTQSFRDKSSPIVSTFVLWLQVLVIIIHILNVSIYQFQACNKGSDPLVLVSTPREGEYTPRKVTKLPGNTSGNSGELILWYYQLSTYLKFESCSSVGYGGGLTALTAKLDCSHCRSTLLQPKFNWGGGLTALTTKLDCSHCRSTSLQPKSNGGGALGFQLQSL